MSLRPVNQHRPVTDQLRQDLAATIAGHPMSFDVVVFPAANQRQEDVTAPALGGDVVGTLEASERDLEYGEPFVSAALEPNNALEHYPMLDAGSGYGLESDDSEPYRLLLKEGPVPKRSVVAFVVDTGNGLAMRAMYVLKGDTIGSKAPAGTVYSLIPYLGGMDSLDGLTLPDSDPSADTLIERLDDLLASVSLAGTTPP